MVGRGLTRHIVLSSAVPFKSNIDLNSLIGTFFRSTSGPAQPMRPTNKGAGQKIKIYHDQKDPGVCEYAAKNAMGNGQVVAT